VRAPTCADDEWGRDVDPERPRGGYARDATPSTKRRGNGRVSGARGRDDDGEMN